MGNLSTELIDMLFHTILNDSSSGESIATTFETAINFAIAHKRLLSVGKRHILTRLTELHARHVGYRLVCIGEYAYGEDQDPPGMLTATELHEIATTPLWSENLDTDSEDTAAGRHLASLVNETYRDYGDVVRSLREPLLDLLCCISDIFSSYRRAKKQMPSELSRDLSMVRRLACGNWLKFAYPDRPAVLCNLSKSKYVREDQLTARRKNVEYTCTHAHALLSQICWSSCVSFGLECTEEYRERLARGPLAGDLFCITSLEGMPALGDGREWADVTAEADQLLCHLWEMNCSGDADEDHAND